MQLATTDYALNLRIDRYESDSGFGNPSEPDWLVLSATFGRKADPHTVGGISLTTEDAGHLVTWMRSVARGKITFESPLNRRRLLSFAEPDMAALVLEPASTGVTTLWLFRDPASLEDYSWMLMNFNQARAVELTTTRRALKLAADDLSNELSNYPNR